MVSLWAPVVLWMGVIYYFSSLSAPFGAFKEALGMAPLRDGILGDVLDWTFHVFEYGVLAFLLARAFGRTFSGLSFFWVGAAVFLAGFSYGITDEWHQQRVPGRGWEFSDMIADSLGLGLGIFLQMRRFRFLRSSSTHA